MFPCKVTIHKARSALIEKSNKGTLPTGFGVSRQGLRFYKRPRRGQTSCPADWRSAGHGKIHLFRLRRGAMLLVIGGRFRRSFRRGSLV